MILGLDPGFAHLGWARRTLSGEITGMGVIRTQKLSGKKSRVSVACDDHRRAKKIWNELNRLAQGVELICAEAISYPRAMSAAAKLARGWGVIDALCALYEIPMVQAPPRAIKARLGATPGQSKNAVISAIRESYDCPVIQDFMDSEASSRHEHAFDAIGAILACEDSPEYQLLRRFASRPRE